MSQTKGEAKPDSTFAIGAKIEEQAFRNEANGSLPLSGH